MGIPLRVNLSFFITAALIGFLSSHTLVGTLVWIAIIFVSIMVHEYGHALTSRAFGQSPRIELVAFGGLTIPSGPKLALWKEFIVVLCGPLFGLILAGIAYGVYHAGVFEAKLLVYAVFITFAVNAFWTIVNLLPVMPLDGGQLLRIILESIFGVKGVRYSVCVGMVLSLAIALYALIYGAIIFAILFFIFAYQNFEMFRGTRNLEIEDSDEQLRLDLQSAETAFVSGDLAFAKEAFIGLREKAHKGMIYACSTEFLAQIHAMQNDSKGAYDLLVEVEEHLSDDGKCLLNTVAFDVKDYQKVVSLSGFCFQTFPSYEVALNAAKSAAKQNDVDATIGWLKSTLKFDIDSLDEIIKDQHFDSVRSDAKFTTFCENI